MSAPAERPQSVMGRALLLLEPFRSGNNLTLTDLAEHAGLPRSSAHRMLVQLVDVGWLRRTGTTYQLGPKMMELGSLAQAHDRIHRTIVATMHRLHRRSGMAVHLCVVDGEDLLCLEKISSRWGATSLDTHIGQRRPAHGTAEGAALLDLRDGATSAAHEQIVVSDKGVPAHVIAVAFDAGRGEAAALSLAGPADRTPADAHHRLILAAELAVAELADERPSRGRRPSVDLGHRP